MSWNRWQSRQPGKPSKGTWRTSERQRIVELELQQARYEASLAERRYAACDPDNRLIAAQLEKSWEAALRRVAACEARLEAMRTPDPALSRRTSPGWPTISMPPGTRRASPCALASGFFAPSSPTLLPMSTKRRVKSS